MGISTATKKTYRSGLQKYVTFCSQINQPPIPVSEDTLLLFLTHLSQQNVSYATNQVYLSAVRYRSITTTESETSDTLITPQLRYVLKGIRKTCALTWQPRERLPITFSWKVCTQYFLCNGTTTGMSWSGLPVAWLTSAYSESVNSLQRHQTPSISQLTCYCQM